MTALLAFAAVSCGGDGSTDTSPAVTGEASDAAARGEELSRSNGCAGCHGPDFGGGAGPSWIGLAGSQVLLADGSTVVADEAYLVRAIVEPNAEIVEGYNLRMPANNLTDAEVADIVAYIQSLADG